MKFDSFLKVLQAKEKSKETKFSKALEKIQKPPDLSPDEKTFSNMLSKLPIAESSKIEWLEDEAFPTFTELQLKMHEKMLDQKKAIEQTLFFGSGAATANNWWSTTNDPKYWSPYPHVPVTSLSATTSYNYTLISPPPFKPTMTREKAIALNDGTA